MRILLVSPVTPKSFWTLEQSCDLSRARTLIPPLGLLTVAALLPPDWQLRLLDLNTGRISESDWEWADVVFISGMIVHRESMRQVCGQAKLRRIPVVVGGPYPTACPDELLDMGVDFLVLGEAEEIIPKVVAALQNGESSGVFRETEKPSMNISPIPRFDLLRLKDYASMALQTSRGCPFDCEFCDIVQLYGRKPRYKLPEQVIAELDYLRRLGWRGDVFVCDDNFIGNKKHAEALLEKLIPWMKNNGEPFSFWAQTSINLGKDVPLIDLMTEANFASVFVGIESPDSRVLSSARKFHNISNPLAEAIDVIKRNGLNIMASFIIGFDNEEEGAGERICEFVEQNQIPSVMLNTLQVLPKTALWDRLKKEERLLEQKTSGQTTAGRLNYVPTRPASDILREYEEAVFRIYDPRNYLERAYNFFLAMRPTRNFLATGETSAPASEERPSLQSSLKEFRAFLKLAWWQGVLPPYRWQFWRQLIGLIRKNPTRVKKYLVSCATGENMFRMREMVHQRLKHR